jgi:hypothetical protein
MEKATLTLLGFLLLTTPSAVQAQFGCMTNADNTLTITGYTGPGGAVAIPTNINGLPVTSIGDYAFFDYTNLTGVTIPASVTSIGEGAFEDCFNLTNATIANGVTRIGDYAFTTCAKLTSVAIPGSITNIGDYAFAVCNSLTNATIANGVTNIGDDAFWLCTSLTSITIPASVTSIGTFAFDECPSLTSVYFIGNTPTVGSAVFNYDNKATIYYSPCAAGWTNPFAGLPAIAATAPALFSYTTNAGAITITGYSGSCETVIIPAINNGLPVTSIEDFAFSDTSVTSATIPDSVTSIGEFAFSGCSNLTSVTIPDSVTSIGDNAFYNCTSLTSITIPASVTHIGGGAFIGTGLTNAIIANGVTSIGDAAFVLCVNLTSVTIPNSVTSIGFEAFGFCAGLTSITIPGNVTNIGAQAFDYCSGLTSVTIVNGVTSIGDEVFYSCPDLTSVMIPASVTKIGDQVFDMCFSLTAITVDTNNSFYSSMNGVLFDKNQTTLMQFPEAVGGSYTIPRSVTSIVDYAFDQCTKLTSVTVPGSVTNIGIGAFQDCSGLTSLFFQGNAPAAVEELFEDDNEGITVYYLPGTTGWSNTFSSFPTVPAVEWNPLIQTGDGSFGVQSNQFGFNIIGTTNFTFVVEACTNLANPVWVPLTTNTLTNGSFYFSDPQWTNYPSRFYGLGLP